MPGGGNLRISLLDSSTPPGARTVSGGGSDEAVLVIEDTGVGMSEEVVSKLFDPFFTTKPRGKGTGLGMAMVHGIVEEHDGTIHVESQPGNGTRISLRLRRCEAPDAIAEDAVSGDAIAGECKRRVLLAEDNEFVRAVMIQTLKAAHFEVVDVCSGAEAWARFKDSPDDFAVVILDADLPEMSGSRCLREIRSLRPNTPALLVTDSPDVDADEDRDEHLVVLCKPFKMSQMVSLTRILLAKG
jgi:CheY-like chemotaxis protein